MGNWLADLRFSLRMWAKNPGVTLAAMLSLALALGANTLVFNLVDSVLLDPLSLPDPERLLSVHTYDASNAGGPRGAMLQVSFPNFEDLRERNQVFSHLVAYQSRPMALSIEGDPEEVLGQAVSEGYFEMLGVEPARGRFFLPAENHTPGSHPVMVLSHGLWQRRLGADPDILGRKLLLNRHPFEVVGIAPAGFTGATLLEAPELWVPYMMHDQVFTGFFHRFFELRRALFFHVLGRLRPGVTPAQADAAMRNLGDQLAAEYPDANGGRGVRVLSPEEAYVRPDMQGTFVRAGAMLMAAVGLVSLIAFANVANLLLARADGRRFEIALRLSLGSPRLRLVRQLLLESLLMALAASLLGLLFAHWCRGLLWAQRPPILARAAPDFNFDARVLGFTLLFGIISALLFGLAPALQATRPALISALRGRFGAGRGHRTGRLRGALVALEIAICLVALIGAGLFLRSLNQARLVDPGFDVERLGALAFDLGPQGLDPQSGRELQRRILGDVRALPGVESATLASSRPLSLAFNPLMRTIVPAGQDVTDPRNGTLTSTDAVALDYFETLGIQVVRGRDFHTGDREDTARVAIVSEAMGRRFWPRADAVGQRFTVLPQRISYEVVGVARDRKVNTLGEEPVPYIYFPLEQRYSDRLQLFVRAVGGPEKVLEGVRRQLREIAPQLPVTEVSTLEQGLAAARWAPRLAARLLSFFGLLALSLATIGVYGVTAYEVGRRRRELAIRLALGANRSSLLRLVLRRTLRLAALGLAAGWVAAGLLAPLVRGLLYGIAPIDSATFMITGLVLAALALLAALASSLGATRVEPARALRAD